MVTSTLVSSPFHFPNPLIGAFGTHSWHKLLELLLDLPDLLGPLPVPTLPHADFLDGHVFHFKDLLFSYFTKASRKLAISEILPSTNPYREPTTYLAHRASGTKA